jgi:GNAT superfamily N-acetyltransferase
MLSRQRNEIEIDGFSLIPLLTEDDYYQWPIVCFNCGRSDLNEFFRLDAYDHECEFLTKTYYFQPKELTDKGVFFPVGLISFLNDRIEITKDEKKGEKKAFFKMLRKTIPHPKRNYTSYPAVKIGRLGVHIKYQSDGIGSHLINITKKMFITNNRTGCRYLTVDAYNDEPTMRFYLKNHFNFLYDKDKKSEHRIMYFDLKRMDL